MVADDAPVIASSDTLQDSSNKRSYLGVPSRNLNAVIFDKTGTLTLGEFRVVAIDTAEGLSKEEALRIAAGIEAESEHPIARGIVKSADERAIDYPDARDFQNITGKGMVATVDGTEYQMGGPAMLDGVDVPNGLRKAAKKAGDNAQTAIYLNAQLLRRVDLDA